MNINSINEFDVSMLQLSDSLFPTGLYAMSSGLETFFSQKQVTGASELEAIISVFIQNQIGPADCVALGNSYENALTGDLEKLVETDQRLFYFKLVKEIREASVRSGTQLLKCMQEIRGDSAVFHEYINKIELKIASGIYPVALGLSCALLGIPKKKSGLILIYTFTASVIGAALRLGIITHIEGQTVINQLKRVISENVENNINKGLAEMWQFAPEIDITQMRHEYSESSMFIT